MDNKFSINRMMRYAIKNYYENRVIYINGLVFVALHIMNASVKFNYTTNEVLTASFDHISRVTDRFSAIFIFSKFILFTIFCTLSIKGTGGKSKIDNLTLPVSTAEKVTFMALNMTIVVAVVHLIIYMLVSSYTDGCYYFTESSTINTGLFRVGSNMVPADAIQGDFAMNSIFNNMIHINGVDGWGNIIYSVSMNILAVSIVLWGGATFKNSTPLISTIALHIGLAIILSYIFAKMIMPLSQHFMDVTHNFVSFDAIYFIDDSFGVKTLCYFPLILSIVYFTSAYKKYKTTEID